MVDVAPTLGALLVGGAIGLVSVLSLFRRSFSSDAAGNNLQPERDRHSTMHHLLQPIP
jgi:hypothetical protein